MKYIFTEIERKEYYMQIIFYACVYRLIHTHTHTLVGYFPSSVMHFEIENDVKQ